MSEPEKELKPEIIVFAGPNGSGKSTVSNLQEEEGPVFLLGK